MPLKECIELSTFPKRFPKNKTKTTLSQRKSPIINAVSLTALVLAFLAHTTVADEKPTSDWTVDRSTDPMTDKVSMHIVTDGDRYIKGFMDSREIYFFYHCGGGFGLHSQVNFNIDDLECDEYDCEKVQYVSIRIDKNEPIFTKWRFYGDDLNTMHLKSSFSLNENDFINMLKRGNTMKAEVVAINTNEDLQYPEFSLKGFTKAINQCGK